MHLGRNLFLAAAIFMVTAATAIPAVASDPIGEVYRVSGARDFLMQYPRAFEANLTASQEDTPPRILKALRTAMKETAVDTSVLDSLYLSRLRKAMNVTTAKAALKFLKSPTGRTVTEAERRASTVEAMAEMKAFFKDKGPAEFDRERIELLRILDTSTGTSEMVANLNLSIRHAMVMAFDSARPEDERQGADALWSVVQQNEAQVRFETQQQTLAAFLFAYRAVTKADLRTYLDFARSGQGLEYHRVLASTMSDTLMEINRSLAQVCARELLKE